MKLALQCLSATLMRVDLTRDFRGYARSWVMFFLALSVVPSLFAQIQASQTVYFQTIKTFGLPDQSGCCPAAPLVPGNDGWLYGTANGRDPEPAKIFRVASDGSHYRVIYQFTLTARCRVIEGSDGKLYGTLSQTSTNKDIVFSLNNDGSGFAVLHQFASAPNDLGGIIPGLTEGTNGMLYGVSGGAGSGAIFRLSKDGGNYQIIYYFGAFPGDGTSPQTLIVRGPGNTLYGTTAIGGTNNQGTIYKLNDDGTGYQMLHSFSNIGTESYGPNGELLYASDGNFYGTLLYGGTAGFGSIYRIYPDASFFNIIHNFNSTFDGPSGAGLTEGTNGALYGITGGGSGGFGSVFKVNKNGLGFATLHEFSAQIGGAFPSGKLWIGTNGVIVGTTLAGGAFNSLFGTLFTLNPDGTGFAVAKSFSGVTGGDAVRPFAHPVEAADGRLYGTTGYGGDYNLGAVYGVNKDGSGYQLLHQFSSEGQLPFAPLVLSSGGVLFGTADGGVNTNGIVFRMNCDGTGFAVLHAFDSFVGSLAHGALVEGSGGFLFGTTPSGGSNSLGTIFKIDTNGGSYSVIHEFGATPDLHGPQAGLCLASDGLLYGITYYGGLSNAGGIFQIAQDGGSYLKLVDFTNGILDLNSGGGAISPLLQASDGTLFGATYRGGVSNWGIAFRLDLGGANFQVLHSFGTTTNDISPDTAFTEGADGALYGTSYGTVFKVGKDWNGYTILTPFGGGTNIPGIYGLLRGSDNLFYGVSGVALGSVYKMWPPQTPTLAVHATGGGEVSVSGTPGAQYHFLESSNLVDWISASDFVMPQSGTWTWTNTPLDPTALFFRASWNP